VSKNSKSYKIAAILFSISGLLFIIATIIGGYIVFLLVGIVLIIMSIVFWQQSKRFTNGVNKKED